MKKFKKKKTKKKAIKKVIKSDSRTPKQRFDDEMKDINTSIAPEKEAGYSDKEVKEHEEEVETMDKMVDEVKEDSNVEKIDKNMGQQKYTVTQQQHLDQKLSQQRQHILQSMMKAPKKTRLTFDQTKTMNAILVLMNDKKITDPVLKHLVEKKLDVAKEQIVLVTQIKEVQLEVVDKMSKLTEKSMTNQGAMDYLNKDILTYVQKNPTVLGEK